MESAFHVAHEAVLKTGFSRRLIGAGTTLTIACIQGSEMRVGHVGDSRLYLVRGRGQRCMVSQLTTDHGADNVLSNCLGVQRYCLKFVEGRQLGAVPLRTGDVVVLATDGLTRYLSEDGRELAQALLPGFEGVADRLVEHALRSGGEDNVTVVAVCYT